jgi:hypothetical protein
MIELQTALTEYCLDPLNPEKNYNIAVAYDRLGHNASALSFYVRCAEKSDDKKMQYLGLINAARCLEKQGSRLSSTVGVFQQAISVCPERPEAYYLLSKIYEKKKDWQNAYTMACIGLSVADRELEKLPDCGYPGKFALEFQKIVSSWWVGFYDQSKQELFEMKYRLDIDNLHRVAIEQNLKTVKYPSPCVYTKKMLPYVVKKFPGIENIERNYAQTFQDLFVLTVLNGKESGYYVEIGSGDPFISNNTALLEQNYSWRGLSIDNNRDDVVNFKESRKNPVVCVDATKVNYNEIFSQFCIDREVDYLQIDCEPPEISLQVLENIPFNQYKFSVVTFEHDGYRAPEIREKSREILKNSGYLLVVNDVAFNDVDSYEDWWINPAIISRDIIEKIKNITEYPKFAGDVIFKI